MPSRPVTTELSPGHPPVSLLPRTKDLYRTTPPTLLHKEKAQSLQRCLCFSAQEILPNGTDASDNTKTQQPTSASVIPTKQPKALLLPLNSGLPVLVDVQPPTVSIMTRMKKGSNRNYGVKEADNRIKPPISRIWMSLPGTRED
ncbi:hypothetical protein N658DRAFT_136868 [Parathielavia hyrcaniae]|uniref:Uncharacterized protein n=1 Tax=Parathielavia hyrcaniae TaxID=113614 RepID=A0AAN6Q920_9PEZI|nr:hypothetical protein N658DRAFT_136868 [Parathielavia hyrcaniae]